MRGPGRAGLSGLAFLSATTVLVAGSILVPGVRTETLAQTIVSGPAVLVAATATDNVGVTGVQFLLDGEALGAEDTTAPYRIAWDTTRVENGLYTLTARARDAAGNETVSSPLSVSVVNGLSPDAPRVSESHDDDDAAASEPTQVPAGIVNDLAALVPGGDSSPPVVTTLWPAEQSTVSGVVSLAAVASDDVGVVGVQFLLDGAPLGAEDLTPPYEVFWDTQTVADGSFSLSARARDASGNVTTSSGVLVVVRHDTEVAEGDTGDPNPDASEPRTGSETLALTVERMAGDLRRVRLDGGSGNKVELYIDGQQVAVAEGSSLAYDWDIRPLMGLHEIHTVATDGAQVVGSASLSYSVATSHVPSVTLEVVEFPIIGASFVRALADVDGVVRTELYIDRQLRLMESSAEVEYAWDPGPAGAHEILFVAYGTTGIVASTSVLH